MPFFFIIYIDEWVKSFCDLKCSLYADDTCLSLASSQLHILMEVFNSEVAHVDSWFKANYLTLNPSKSNYLIFHRDRKLLPGLRSGLTIGGQEVVRVTFVRFLGVFLDECHVNPVNSVACKVSRYTSLVYKLFRYPNLDSLMLMYHTMVYSNKAN